VKGFHDGMRENHCEPALECVEEQCGDAERLVRARNVGGADVAGTGRAYVFLLEGADEDIAERNRTEQISVNGSEKPRHR
jgi:hypothetical protein